MPAPYFLLLRTLSSRASSGRRFSYLITDLIIRVEGDPVVDSGEAYWLGLHSLAPEFRFPAPQTINLEGVRALEMWGYDPAGAYPAEHAFGCFLKVCRNTNHKDSHHVCPLQRPASGSQR
jgi:hypothetical protein